VAIVEHFGGFLGDKPFGINEEILPEVKAHFHAHLRSLRIGAAVDPAESPLAFQSLKITAGGDSVYIELPANLAAVRVALGKWQFSYPRTPLFAGRGAPTGLSLQTAEASATARISGQFVATKDSTAWERTQGEAPG